jgi:hypothetical protein
MIVPWPPLDGIDTECSRDARKPDLYLAVDILFPSVRRGHEPKRHATAKDAIESKCNEQLQASREPRRDLIPHRQRIERLLSFRDIPQPI